MRVATRGGNPSVLEHPNYCRMLHWFNKWQVGLQHESKFKKPSIAHFWSKRNYTCLRTKLIWTWLPQTQHDRIKGNHKSRASAYNTFKCIYRLNKKGRKVDNRKFYKVQTTMLGVNCRTLSILKTRGGFNVMWVWVTWCDLTKPQCVSTQTVQV